MTWKERVAAWLLCNVKVDIDMLCRVIETLDTDKDGYLSLGEIVRGVGRLIKGKL